MQVSVHKYCEREKSAANAFIDALNFFMALFTQNALHQLACKVLNLKFVYTFIYSCYFFLEGKICACFFYTKDPSLNM